MAGRLAHRGPDGNGVWVDADGGMGLAHTRLAIIDLSAGGAQPKELLYKGGMRLVRAATLSDALAVLLPDSVGAAGRRRRSGAGGVGGRRRAVGAGSEGEEGEEEEEEGEAAGW